MVTLNDNVSFLLAKEHHTQRVSQQCGKQSARILFTDHLFHCVHNHSIMATEILAMIGLGNGLVQFQYQAITGTKFDFLIKFHSNVFFLKNTFE